MDLTQKTFDLQRLTIGSSLPVSREDFTEAEDRMERRLLANATVQLEDLDTLRDSFVFRLRTFVYGRKSTFTVDVPCSWWDMFKKAYAPDWFLVRYPVRLDRILIDACEVWPEADAPRDQHTVRYVEVHPPKRIMGL